MNLIKFEMTKDNNLLWYKVTEIELIAGYCWWIFSIVIIQLLEYILKLYLMELIQ